MRIPSLTLGLSLFLFGSGCNSAKPPEPKISEQDQAVSSFKQIVENYMKTYKQSKHEQVYHLEGSSVANIPEGWRKAYSELASDDYKVDVQKTDSLVSPYLGILEFDTKTYVSSSTYGSQEAASQATDFPSDSSLLHKHRHTYAYQEGQWVIQSRKWVYPGENEWNDCDEGN